MAKESKDERTERRLSVLEGQIADLRIQLARALLALLPRSVGPEERVDAVPTMFGIEVDENKKIQPAPDAVPKKDEKEETGEKEEAEVIPLTSIVSDIDQFMERALDALFLAREPLNAIQISGQLKSKPISVKVVFYQLSEKGLVEAASEGKKDVKRKPSNFGIATRYALREIKDSLFYGKERRRHISPLNAREIILTELEKHPNGATMEEISDPISLERNTAQQRVAELKKMKLVESKWAGKSKILYFSTASSHAMLGRFAAIRRDMAEASKDFVPSMEQMAALRELSEKGELTEDDLKGVIGGSRGTRQVELGTLALVQLVRVNYAGRLKVTYSITHRGLAKLPKEVSIPEIGPVPSKTSAKSAGSEPTGPLPDVPLSGTHPLAADFAGVLKPKSGPRPNFHQNPEWKIHVKTPLELNVKGGNLLDILSPTQVTILRKLEKGPLAIEELKPSFVISLYGLRLAIHHLKRRGLVERIEIPDSKVPKFGLSGSGTALIGFINELSKDEEFTTIKDKMKIPGIKELVLRELLKHPANSIQMATALHTSNHTSSTALNELVGLGLVQKQKLVGSRQPIFSMGPEGRKVVEKLDKVHEKAASLEVSKETKVTELDERLLLLLKEDREKHEKEQGWLGMSVSGVSPKVNRSSSLVVNVFQDLMIKGLITRVSKSGTYYYRISALGLSALEMLAEIAKNGNGSAKPDVQKSTDSTLPLTPSTLPDAARTNIAVAGYNIHQPSSPTPDPRAPVQEPIVPGTEAFYILEGIKSFGQTNEEITRYENVLLELAKSHQLSSLDAGRHVLGRLYDDEAIETGNKLMTRLMAHWFANRVVDGPDKNHIYQITDRGIYAAAFVQARRDNQHVTVHDLLRGGTKSATPVQVHLKSAH